MVTLCQALSRRCVRNCPWRIYRRCRDWGLVVPFPETNSKSPCKLAVSQTGKACDNPTHQVSGCQLFFVFSGRVVCRNIWWFPVRGEHVPGLVLFSCTFSGEWNPRVDFCWLSFKRRVTFFILCQSIKNWDEISPLCNS